MAAPTPTPPITNPPGKIQVIISGRVSVTSNNPNVVIIRKG